MREKKTGRNQGRRGESLFFIPCAANEAAGTPGSGSIVGGGPRYHARMYMCAGEATETAKMCTMGNRVPPDVLLRVLFASRFNGRPGDSQMMQGFP